MKAGDRVKQIHNHGPTPYAYVEKLEGITVYHIHDGESRITTATVSDFVIHGIAFFKPIVKEVP